MSKKEYNYQLTKWVKGLDDLDSVLEQFDNKEDYKVKRQDIGCFPTYAVFTTGELLEEDPEIDKSIETENFWDLKKNFEKMKRSF